MLQPSPAAEGVPVTDPPSAEEAEKSPAPSKQLRVRWWVAAATGLGGLLLGVLIAALLLATTPQFGTDPDQRSPRGPDEQPTSRNTVPVTAQARVNAACLRVINEAQDVVRILSGADQAVTDVDLHRLDDIVRRLQPIETRLQRDLRACRVDTSVSGTSTTTPTAPIPTMPQPSPTPS